MSIATIKQIRLLNMLSVQTGVRIPDGVLKDFNWAVEYIAKLQRAKRLSQKTKTLPAKVVFGESVIGKANTDNPATPRQIKFVEDICKKLKIAPPERYRSSMKVAANFIAANHGRIMRRETKKRRGADVSAPLRDYKGFQVREVLWENKRMICYIGESGYPITCPWDWPC